MAERNNSAVDPLKPFARGVIIEYVPDDGETRRAANNLASALTNAGWKITKTSPKYDLDDGVEIDPFFAPIPTPTNPNDWASWKAEIASGEAADALIDFLHSYNWEAKHGFPKDEKGKLIRDVNVLPPDSLIVKVGLYPAVIYIAPPGAKELAAWAEQFKEEREKAKKKSEQDEMKSEEEAVKNLTPQQAADFKARRKEMREKWEKQTKALMDRYSDSPCQPLTPIFPK